MTPEECRENLVAAKKRLTEALSIKGNEKLYWENIKAWFKHRISKEEFDVEARQLLSPGMANLHNEFLLAVLTKCHSIGSSSVNKDTSGQLSLRGKRNKRKMQMVKKKFESRFIPATSAEMMPARNLHQDNKQAGVRKSGKKQEPRLPRQIVFSSRSLEIPSMVEMNGRVAVITWEKGLDDFLDEVSDMVIEAIHILLKNIITAICLRRSAYKVKGRDFKHSVGCTASNPYLLKDAPKFSLFGTKLHKSVKNTKPTYDEAEQLAIASVGQASQNLSPAKQAASLFDLFAILQEDRTLLPANAIYALCIEKISSSLWHPDQDDIEQERRIALLSKPHHKKDLMRVIGKLLTIVLLLLTFDYFQA